MPLNAIVTFAGIEKVLTVAKNSAVEKRVHTGRRLDNQVEILDGISVGEPVIVPPGNLVGGQPVQVIR